MKVKRNNIPVPEEEIVEKKSPVDEYGEAAARRYRALDRLAEDAELTEDVIDRRLAARACYENGCSYEQLLKNLGVKRNEN